MRLKQLEMASSTYRVEPQPAAADRVLPGLFEEEDGADGDSEEEPLLNLLFPLDEAEPVTPKTAGPSPSATALMPTLAAMATPQAIVVPIGPPMMPTARRRSAPKALVVFAAYALLGAAIVLLAGTLRWTHTERANAAAAATVPAPTCPAGMTRTPAGPTGATSCQPVAPPAMSSMHR